MIDCPDLRGDLFMTYGTPQNASKSTYLPIGVALSYDELTLLSCDVHRNSQNVRLFDIETGELKHTITSNKVLKNGMSFVKHGVSSDSEVFKYCICFE